MVSVTFTPLANINGKPGAKGDRGPAGKPERVGAVSVPASEPARAVLKDLGEKWELDFDIPRGLPGVNAVANDAAFATYIEAVDTETRAALEGVFTPKGVFSVDVADLGAVLDGSGDSTPPIQAAIDGWSGAFGTLKLTAPPRSIIRTTGLSIVGKSVHLDFRQSKLVQTAAKEIVYAEGTWGPVVSAGSASRGSVVVADPSNFAVNDKIKVFSNNVIWDARPRIPDDYPTTQPTEFARQGEFARVTGISGNTLSITPPLFDTYDMDQNIRVAKLNEHDVQVEFGTAEYEGAGTGTMFRFKSLFFPLVRGRVLKGRGTAFGFRSCFGAYGDVRVDDLPGGDGYAVASSGGLMGQFRIHATDVRHAYTDDTAGRYTIADAGNDPANYGRAMCDDITGFSFATSEASWDTHHGGIGHRFHDITGSGTENSGAPVFSARGRFHRYDDCLAFGGAVGFRVHAETSGSDFGNWSTTENIEFNNCSSRDTYQGLVVELTTYMPATRGVNLTITGGVYEARGGQLAHFSRARVRFKDPTFRTVLAAAPAATNFFNCGLVDLSGSLTIDAMAVQSGSMADVLAFANAGSSWQSLDLDVKLDFSEYMRANVTSLLRLTTARGQVRLRLNGTTTAATTAGATTTPDQMSVTLKVVGSNTQGSAQQTTNLSANGQTLSPGRSADPLVSIRVFTSANRSIGGVSVAAVAGQELVIINAPSSTGTVTVPVGATNMQVGTAIVIPVGMSKRFTWDSTSNVWIPAM